QQVSASALEVTRAPDALPTTATFSGLAPSNSANMGGGCPGSRGIPSLFPNATPTIGSTFTVRVAYAPPQSLDFFLIGFSNSSHNGGPLPLDLTAQGAPGCFLRTSIEANDLTLTDVNGTSAMNYTIPNNSSFLGAVLYQQVMAFDPTANALGFTTSNGGAATIGQF